MNYQEFICELDKISSDYPEIINTNIYNNAKFYVGVLGVKKSEVIKDIRLYVMEKSCNTADSKLLVESYETEL